MRRATPYKGIQPCLSECYFLDYWVTHDKASALCGVRRTVNFSIDELLLEGRIRGDDPSPPRLRAQDARLRSPDNSGGLFGSSLERRIVSCVVEGEASGHWRGSHEPEKLAGQGSLLEGRGKTGCSR